VLVHCHQYTNIWTCLWSIVHKDLYFFQRKPWRWLLCCWCKENGSFSLEQEGSSWFPSHIHRVLPYWKGCNLHIQSMGSRANETKRACWLERMAALARAPGSLPGVCCPVLHVLWVLGLILEIPHGPEPARQAVERAEGVPSGPRGPDSMVTFCIRASSCSDCLWKSTECCLFHLKSSNDCSTTTVSPLIYDLTTKKFVTADCDNSEQTGSTWTLSVYRGDMLCDYVF